MQRQELLNEFYKKAKEEGYEDLAKDLENLGANLGKITHTDTINLMNAAKIGDLKAIKTLLQNGVGIDQIDADGKTAVMYAVEEGKYNIVKYLINAGANILLAYDEEHEKNAFTLAVISGHLSIFSYLLAKISSEPVNQHIALYKNMLITAVKNNAISMVDKIIPYVKDLNFQVGLNEPYTVLAYAAQYGYFEIVKKLMDAGAIVDQGYEHGATPLFYACRYGHFEIAAFLLANDADPNRRDFTNTPYTPLMVAASQNHSKIVDLLLEKGADPTAYVLNSPWWTAAYLADQANNEALADKIRRAMA